MTVYVHSDQNLLIITCAYTKILSLMVLSKSKEQATWYVYATRDRDPEQGSRWRITAQICWLHGRHSWYPVFHVITMAIASFSSRCKPKNNVSLTSVEESSQAREYDDESWFGHWNFTKPSRTQTSQSGSCEVDELQKMFSEIKGTKPCLQFKAKPCAHAVDEISL